jgi:hypothetical protein
MRLACLCPTYGRPSLVRNALALFLDQQLRPGDSAELLIYDDAGQIATQGNCQDRHCWHVLSSKEREPLQAKYGTMLTYLASGGPVIDAWTVWDDDDIYLPWHLAAHATALESNAWSHPSRAYSTYQGLHERPLSGRHYHGALAIRADLMRDLQGWPDTDRSDYDKQQLARCRSKAGPPGDPCRHFLPSYVYRWSDTQRDHCSARIRDGRYQPPRIQEPGPVPILTPQYDASAKAILQQLVSKP